MIHPDQLVCRAPVDGLDAEPLRPYIAALEDPSLPRARFQWRNPHEAAIAADQFLSVQARYAPGGSDRPGLLLVEPRSTGLCQITLN